MRRVPGATAVIINRSSNRQRPSQNEVVSGDVGSHMVPRIRHESTEGEGLPEIENYNEVAPIDQLKLLNKTDTEELTPGINGLNAIIDPSVTIGRSFQQKSIDLKMLDVSEQYINTSER